MDDERANADASGENTEHSLNQADELLSTFATAEIPPDISDEPQRETSINDPDHIIEERSASSSSSRRHSTAEGFLTDGLEEGRTGTKSASSRSSLSSIPDSVVVHSKDPSTYGRDSIGEIYEEQGYMGYENSIYPKIRDRNSPFRHPSSVKAIQMQTEDEEDEEFMSPSRRRGPGFRSSPASVQSLGSPLLRRQGYHSAGGTPKKSSLKKENPLVLLHCNILSPTVVLGPGIKVPDRTILQKVLPTQYWRRWMLLEEKIIASGLLRDRGLLIQHPQEDYELLEERVLESLELQKPRLANGHFISHEASDSEGENTGETQKHSDDAGEKSCADCGCHINHRDERRKWDVKFYAANGLMKEGAWTAAWKEVERVDVQVSLWLPYEVKIEVEKRIQEEQLLLAAQAEVKIEKPIVNTPEVNTQEKLSQDQIDGLDDAPPAPLKKPSVQEISRSATSTPERTRINKTNQDPDLHTLIINSIRVLLSDRRNVITTVSVIFAFLAVAFGGRPSRRTQYESDVFQFGNLPVVSTQVYHTSSASILTQCSTEIPLPKIENSVERPGEIQRMAEGVMEERLAPSGVVMQATERLDEVPVVETQEADSVVEIPEEVPAIKMHETEPIIESQEIETSVTTNQEEPVIEEQEAETLIETQEDIRAVEMEELEQVNEVQEKESFIETQQEEQITRMDEVEQAIESQEDEPVSETDEVEPVIEIQETKLSIASQIDEMTQLPVPGVPTQAIENDISETTIIEEKADHVKNEAYPTTLPEVVDNVPSFKIDFSDEPSPVEPVPEGASLPATDEATEAA